jgi:hypothetical protein
VAGSGKVREREREKKRESEREREREVGSEKKYWCVSVWEGSYIRERSGVF